MSAAISSNAIQEFYRKKQYKKIKKKSSLPSTGNPAREGDGKIKTTV
jgi:hypothetical protein